MDDSKVVDPKERALMAELDKLKDHIFTAEFMPWSMYVQEFGLDNKVREIFVHMDFGALPKAIKAFQDLKDACDKRPVGRHKHYTAFFKSAETRWMQFPRDKKILDQTPAKPGDLCRERIDEWLAKLAPLYPHSVASNFEFKLESGQAVTSGAIMFFGERGTPVSQEARKAVDIALCSKPGAEIFHQEQPKDLDPEVTLKVMVAWRQHMQKLGNDKKTEALLLSNLNPNVMYAGQIKGCRGCHKKPETPLQACCKCKSARYCSRECQRKDWHEGGHKQLCSDEAQVAKDLLASCGLLA